jgi:hypothetical protein
MYYFLTCARLLEISDRKPCNGYFGALHLKTHHWTEFYKDYRCAAPEKMSHRVAIIFVGKSIGIETKGAAHRNINMLSFSADPNYKSKRNLKFLDLRNISH